MQVQSNKLDFKGQNIYVGLDVHKKQWKATILMDDLALKTFSQPPDPDTLHKYLRTNFPGGNYYTAYEAGFCGFWLLEYFFLTSCIYQSIIIVFLLRIIQHLYK